MVKINFMGDVMLGELLENYRRGLRTVLRKKGLDPFGHVRPVLDEADLNVINLECIFSDTSILPKPFSEILIAPTGSLKYLTDNGINVVNTANNHALDHGRKQFEDSVRLLRENGIHVIGYDTGCYFQEEPVIIEAGGMRLGFLGYNISNFPDADKRKAIDRIKEVVSSSVSSVDKLVVSMHWGEEYTNIPPPYVIRYGRELLASGCDILHGHHSHYIQGVIKTKNRIFAPSLGNFIFDQMVEKNRISGILKIQIDERGSIDFTYLPCYESAKYQQEEAPRYFEYLKEITGYVENCWREGNEDLYADMTYAMVLKGHGDNRMRMRATMLEHFWHYLPYALRIIGFRLSKKKMFSVIEGNLFRGEQ